jgi:hypothetical protein
MVADGTVTSGSAQMQRFSIRAKGKVSAEYEELRARKKRLANYGQAYSNIKTTFESQTFEVLGDTATADVTEKTEMTYTTGGPPQTYIYEQVVEFTKADNGWVIDNIKPKSPNGTPPSTVVSAEQLAYAKNPPGSQAALKIGTGRVATPAKAVAPNDHVPETKPAVGPKTGATTPSLMAGYDYTAMVNYARSWALGRNGAYRQFGNDCQNFVSQSLKAGGWQDQGGWYQYDSSWWYDWANQTYSRTGAQNFHNFAVGQGRVTYLSYLNDLGPADVLQVHWPEGTPDVDHSMFVTYSPWSAGTRDIRVSNHTNDVLDRSVWDLYASFPYATWYGLRT